MPFPHLVLQIIEHSWELSVAVIPVLFAVFGLIGVVSGVIALSHVDRSRFVEIVVVSQRDLVAHYGIHLVAGLLTGGVLNLFLPGESLVPGAVAAIGVLAYAHVRLPVPDTGITLESAQDYLYTGIWLVLPWFALAALALSDILFMSLVALVFYTALFWRI